MSYEFVITVRDLIDFAKAEGFEPGWAFTVLYGADILEPSYLNQFHVMLRATKVEIAELWRAADATARLDRK